MSIRNLINGQTIRIDNHTRGCNSKFEWNEAVHLHKRMNGDNRFNRAEVIIPLHNKGEIEFRKIEGKSQKVKDQLKNEIKEAFKNVTIRNEFIRTFNSELVEKLKDCNIHKYNQKTIIENALMSIASFFGIKPRIQKEIHLSFMNLYKVRSENEPDFYMNIHTDTKRDRFSLVMSENNDEIISSISDI